MCSFLFRRHFKVKERILWFFMLFLNAKEWKRIRRKARKSAFMNKKSSLFVWGFLADMPVVTLKMGSSLNPDDIKEGADVYFECLILSNPKPYKMSWYHNVSSSTDPSSLLNISLWISLTEVSVTELSWNLISLSCAHKLFSLSSFSVDAFANTKREFNKL